MRIIMALIISALSLQGCSIYMAATQPDKKNMAVLEKGIPRVHVIEEFGQPQSTTTVEEDGIRTDMFSFYRGSSYGWKTGRAVFHSVADVFSLGIWEVIGTPTEAAVKGDPIKMLVEYTDDDRVVSWKISEVPSSTGPDADVESSVSSEEGV